VGGERKGVLRQDLGRFLSLLADAESGEDSAEDFFRDEGPADGAEVVEGVCELEGDQFDLVHGVGLQEGVGLFEADVGGLEFVSLAGGEGEGFAGEVVGGVEALGEVGLEVVEALSGGGADGEAVGGEVWCEVLFSVGPIGAGVDFVEDDEVVDGAELVEEVEVVFDLVDGA